MSLQYGSLIGLLIVAGGMAMSQRLLNFDGVITGCHGGSPRGAAGDCHPLDGSAVSRMTGNTSVDGQASQAFEYQDHRLYTGSLPEGSVSGEHFRRIGTRDGRRVLPTIVFVLSAFVAFCTGTSWGTMGILVPMVVTLAHALLTRDGPVELGESHIFSVAWAGVLAGAVFGDHCSPLSDTTVLSSQASGCDHIAHVWTQMPYAHGHGGGGDRGRDAAAWAGVFRCGYCCRASHADWWR